MQKKKAARKVALRAGPFIRLPKDVHELVLDFIPSANDLISLGLTRKKLWDIILPRIYRKVSLTTKTNGYPFRDAEGFFTPGNRGHPFVRKIHFDFQKKDHTHGQCMIDITLKDVLSPDQLYSFSAPNVPCHEALVLMLLRTQRQLHKLCLGPLKFDHVPLQDTTLRVEDWLSQLKILNIPKRARSYNELAMYRNIIAKAKLSEVRINCLGLEEPQLWFEEDLDSRPQCLFDQLHVACTSPLKLDHLTLQHQNHGRTGQAYTAYIDFSKLHSLKVCKCENSESLLVSLAAQFRTYQPRLTHLVLDLTLELFSKTPTYLESFFRSFGGLKLLRITTRSTVPTLVWQDPFNADCLATHAATLATFSVSLFWDDVFDWEPCAVSTDFLVWIAKHCLCLEQIGIALSEAPLQNGQEGLFGEFGDEVELLFRLPRLRILRLLTMPTVDPDFFVQNPHASPNDRDKELMLYKSHLNKFATMLMKLKGNSKRWHWLPFLCFGNFSRNTIGFGNCSRELRPICYAPAGNVDLTGIVTAHAMQIPTQQALSLEPRADHLFKEYEPNRRTMMPEL